MDIDSLVEAPIKEKADDAFWAKINSHPAFMNAHEIMTSDATAVKALQAIKYQSEDPNENALSFKEEGNHHYKKKEFHKAIDCYTAGLIEKPRDPKIYCDILSNRSLCNFYLKNYGKCIEDCRRVVVLDSKHLKAHVRGAESALFIGKTNVAFEFVTNGLEIDPDSEKLKELQIKCLKISVNIEKESNEKQQKEEFAKMNQLLQRKLATNRGVKIDPKLSPVDCPGNYKTELYTDSHGVLFWPVLLMYPEHGQTDFMHDVSEELKISDILQSFFGPKVPSPAWDRKKHYKLPKNSLEVYFEEIRDFGSYSICDNSWSIKELTQQKQFGISTSLIIVLHVVSKNSPFHESWLRSIKY